MYKLLKCMNYCNTPPSKAEVNKNTVKILIVLVLVLNCAL